ncbi:MAG: endonuclease MutS2 [Clostridiales bacterium]|nr:endonuclease MutS2 [Clostridiales bacterium]
MNSKYLKTLEFDKIIKIVASFAQSNSAIEEIKKLKPIFKKNEIVYLLKKSSDAISLLLRKGSPNFAGIKSIKLIEKRLNIEAMLNNTELLIIRDNLYLSRLAKEYIKEKNLNNDNKEEEIKNIFRQLFVNHRLENEIRRCIISSDEIADDASQTLFKIRRSILNLKGQVKDQLNNYIKSEKYKKFIQDSIITMRDDRYVIPVKREYQSEIKGMVHDVSSSGATLFVEPAAIVKINNKIKELYIEEKKEILVILKDLSLQSAEYINEIVNNYEVLLELDILYAKAKFALEYKCMIPKINDDKKVRIIQGRHPLISQEVVVPIDFHIGESFNTLVITGPNTGGKTVSLKTVGIITLLAQTGIPVPAKEGTQVTIFTKIFADIGDEQSIEQSLSTFSSHMTNIINILKNVDENSLVLLDELGAGTDPTEGAALALSIIEYLQDKKCTTIATTHYNDIKIYASVNDGIENASCEFDVKTLSPTFKLLIGIPGKSNALYISRRLGLNHNVIENAKKFINNENTDYENVILSLEKSRQKIEKEAIKSVSKRKEIEQLENSLQKKLREIEHEKSKVIKKAEEKAEKIINDAIKNSDEIINQLNKLKKDGKIIINAKEEANLKNLLKQSQPRLKNTLIKTDKTLKSNIKVKVGDEVFITTLNKKASVLQIADKNGDVLVQAGIMKISVPLSNLKKIAIEKSSNVNTFGFQKAAAIKLELDIRGMNIMDADIEIEKYLDDCFIAGLIEVQIIHGKGTGALRKGVHALLRKNSHTKSFRIGVFGEGENGVTVVTLKTQ